jgi:hypothetical protein
VEKSRDKLLKSDGWGPLQAGILASFAQDVEDGLRFYEGRVREGDFFAGGVGEEIESVFASDELERGAGEGRSFGLREMPLVPLDDRCFQLFFLCRFLYTLRTVVRAPVVG